ncbi:2-phosphosulfolactate phosphatase [Paenibacillus sp. UNCCL117]|uniref:2-phosphosulfolactate phosphatase n=1 Tax=unclassified Paenibacillus TaxID=185978 RepID=UPI00088A32E5|nr:MULTISPECIES: 2-phosphosulfolactate phosphatase [unclassified Paenibacillus]SDD43716.1 2-phosphosulfolactate phosphatase [Paenibacillus sp. cl123]SFW47301.1 2-phosphosulfolactate phosphatase [Paenibacillus sp. UNCCL117]
MHIQVISSVNEARGEDLQQKTVVVIDVLRATSTILKAIDAGCVQLIPVETVNQARSLQRPGELLGGERFCKKIPGFDIGNSPLEYTPERVEGKTVILTTTNGTRAIQKASKAGHIVIGSLLNARACARRAIGLGEDIVILCAGAQDMFALEDGLCAGLLVEEMLSLKAKERSDGSGSGQITVDDFGLAMLHLYRQAGGDLEAALLSGAGGKRLSRIGFREDVAYCSQVNVLEQAPIVRNGRLEAGMSLPL